MLPDNYNPTDSEKRVLEECARGAASRAGIGTLIGLGISQVLRARRRAPFFKFSSLLSVAGYTAAGFYIGIASYQSKCMEKLMALEDSPLGNHLRSQMEQRAPARTATDNASPAEQAHQQFSRSQQQTVSGYGTGSGKDDAGYEAGDGDEGAYDGSMTTNSHYTDQHGRHADGKSMSRHYTDEHGTNSGERDHAGVTLAENDEHSYHQHRQEKQSLSGYSNHHSLPLPSADDDADDEDDGLNIARSTRRPTSYQEIRQRYQHGATRGVAHNSEATQRPSQQHQHQHQQQHQQREPRRNQYGDIVEDE